MPDNLITCKKKKNISILATFNPPASFDNSLTAVRHG